MVWGFDLFKNLQSNSLPTGKPFQSIATKFPHPGLHIAVKYPKVEPKKRTIKICPNKTLQSLFIYITLLHHQYMFLLQLELYIDHNPCYTAQNTETFRRKSTFCKFEYTVLSKGYKESQFYKLTVTVANEPYTDQLYLQKSTWFLFTSVYFDIAVSWEVQLIKNTLKQTKFEDKTVKSTQLSLVIVGHHDFQIFPDRTVHA